MTENGIVTIFTYKLEKHFLRQGHALAAMGLKFFIQRYFLQYAPGEAHYYFPIKAF